MGEHFKNKQRDLEIKNMKEQIDSDSQYKEMFGGDGLVIKRSYRVQKVVEKGISNVFKNIMIHKEED